MECRLGGIFANKDVSKEIFQDDKTNWPLSAMPLQEMMLHTRRAAAVLSAKIHCHKKIKLLPKANRRLVLFLANCWCCLREWLSAFNFWPLALWGSRQQTESWWKLVSKCFQGSLTWFAVCWYDFPSTWRQTLGSRTGTVGAPMQMLTLRYINTAAEGGPAHSVWNIKSPFLR